MPSFSWNNENTLFVNENWYNKEKNCVENMTFKFCMLVDPNKTGEAER